MRALQRHDIVRPTLRLAANACAPNVTIERFAELDGALRPGMTLPLATRPLSIRAAFLAAATFISGKNPGRRNVTPRLPRMAWSR